MKLDPKVEAKTLSVVMNPQDSVTCYVQLDEESCNLTLRLEDDVAKLAGYPQSWTVWDEIIPGTSETYGEAEDDASIDSWVNEIESPDAYVSRKTENEILRQLIQSLKIQFLDEMFTDQLSSAQKESVFEKMNKAIQSLK
jgi:hypothetical protein